MIVSTHQLQFFIANARLTILALLSIISTPLLATEPQHLQLGIHQVGSWHVSSDHQLVIEDHQNNHYLVTLKPPCEGLENAKSIAFISHGSTLDESSTLILSNGNRCPFKTFAKQTATTEQ